MNVVDVSRWQFGITTVYHFIFVPLTIGLAPLIAVMQTVWVATDNVAWYRLTKFFGKLFLINFALGVATGIVQEFQFGMNWSEYSRFVGDVFGAPLAMEGSGRVLLRIHLPRIVDLRLEPTPPPITWPASGSSPLRSTCPRSSSSRRTPSCSTRSAPTTTRKPDGPS